MSAVCLPASTRFSFDLLYHKHQFNSNWTKLLNLKSLFWMTIKYVGAVSCFSAKSFLAKRTRIFRSFTLVLLMKVEMRFIREGLPTTGTFVCSENWKIINKKHCQNNYKGIENIRVNIGISMSLWWKYILSTETYSVTFMEGIFYYINI